MWLLSPAPNSNEESSTSLLAGSIRSMAVRVSTDGATSKIQHQLNLAGNPSKWNVERIFVAKGAAALVLGAVCALETVSFGFLKMVIVASLAAVFGFFLPNILLYNAGSKRQGKIQKALPDTLDLLSVSMRAGLGFDAAVGRVAVNSSGPLSAEFARMLQELRLGISRSSAIRNLMNRTTVADLKYVMQAVIQADSLGIPIADVLAQKGKEMRVKRRQRAEEAAQKVTVKILFPMLLFIFPALMVVIIGPGVIRVLEVFGL